MSSPDSSPGARFDELVGLMARLRSPDGCPWDREQTLASIKKYTLEETYEVFDAIDDGDWAGLREELGDFLLQAVFYARIAEEAGHFSIADSLASINGKLIRRHPHVFGDGDAKTADQVKKRWDEIKQAEKGSELRSRLAGVSRAQPALAEAQAITGKAADVGFDWPDTNQVIEKLHEELAELGSARQPDDIEAEMGDVLFVAVNLARKLGVDAEQALRRTNRKFRHRFGYIERAVEGNFEGRTLEELDRLWNEAKQTSLSAS